MTFAVFFALLLLIGLLTLVSYVDRVYQEAGRVSNAQAYRIEADLNEKRATEADFSNYAHNTSLGLVALEVLAAIYPCEEEDTGGAKQP